MGKALKIFALCMAGSFATAVVFVITMTLSLPESDGAYGQMPFEDPLVFPIMCIGAGLAGVIVFPFVYLALRNKDIVRCSIIVFSIVIAGVIVLTLLGGALGMFGSFVFLAIALAVCASTEKDALDKDNPVEDTAANAADPHQST